MKKRWLLILSGVAVMAATAILVGQHALAGPTIRVGRRCNDPDRPSVAQVSHGMFDALLQKYVDQRGMVAYVNWRANVRDMQALDAYLAKLGCVNLQKQASKKSRLAFWINAYNAVTIRGILREYPTSSIRNHTAKLIGYNIWKDLKLWVDGNSYSLDNMEHKILRKMGEPRIHFAVNCASIGCPPLNNRAYTAENLEQLLDYNARRFFASTRNFRADGRSQTLYVSKLLQWYGGDFASTPQEQMRALLRYFPNSQSLTWINTSRFSIRYLNYDWNLNDQNPQG